MHRHQPHHEPDDQKSAVKITPWRLVCLALLASAWGLSELIGGETVVLTGIALILLVAARTLVNRPGSSTALAAIALLFKSVNTAPFLCHMGGIAALGIAFDITATLLWREDRRTFLRAIFAGGTSAYLSCFLFASSMVWIFQYRSWPDGGLARVAQHTFLSGSRGALAALIAVPVGLWIGRMLMRQAACHPRTVLAAAVTACLALWVLGPFAG